MNLLKSIYVDKVINATAAGTSDTISGSISDTANYDGILYLACLGDNANTAVVTFQAQQNTANSSSGMATLAGTSSSTLTATSGDNKVLALDIYRPRERYLRPQIVRATANIVIDSVVAILYQGRTLPVTQGSNVLSAVTLVSPAEA